MKQGNENDLIAILKKTIVKDIREHPIDAGSVITMIDRSGELNPKGVIDISFSTIQNNRKMSELLEYLTAVKLRKED